MNYNHDNQMLFKCRWAFVGKASQQGCSEKSANYNRFRFICLPTFNIFGPIWIIGYPVESCKITVILFGYTFVYMVTEEA